MLRPRIQVLGVQYKTGTGQRWTDRYTWEDYVVLVKSPFPISYVPLTTGFRNILAEKEIKKYFENHPEALLEAEPFKGLTMEEIKIKAMSMSV